MKFPLPLQLPEGHTPIITQHFGVSTEELEPAGPNGEPHYHYGTDIVLGTDHDTYGAALRLPFPVGRINQYLQPTQGMQNTPFVQLLYPAQDGTKYEIVLAHVSEIEPAKDFVYGDIVAKVGNLGLVYPQPNLKDPYQGAHLHLGLKVNGAWVDPEQYFDFTKWFTGAAPTQQDQLPATNWLITELLAIIKGITGTN